MHSGHRQLLAPGQSLGTQGGSSQLIRLCRGHILDPGLWCVWKEAGRDPHQSLSVSPV